jgi:hypothetical protein
LITIDDIAAAISARLIAATGYSASLPGQAWFRRASDPPPNWPYSVFLVEKAGDDEMLSDGDYLQGFTIRISSYYRQGLDTPNAAPLFLLSAINTAPTVWSPLRGAPANSILHCLPQAWDGKFDTNLRQGRGVFVPVGQWEMLTNGDLTS